MGTFFNAGDTIVGSRLLGRARKIRAQFDGECLYPEYNNEQYFLTRKTKKTKLGIRSECIIEQKSKINFDKKRYRVLEIHSEENSLIFGNELYCECEKGELTEKMGKRFRKLGARHGQGCIFKGDLAVGVVTKEFEQTRSFSLSKYITKDKIIQSKN
jgi:hypothetical protein